MKDKLTLVDLFAEQVRKTPNAYAVLSNGSKVSFSKLDKVSNKVASQLIQRGIGKGDLVPVMLECGHEIISALLGILKSGAAFVPVDLTLPDERINYIIQDCNPKILINEKTYATFLENSESECINRSSLEQPAYVIYTSGSTGRPKGVLVNHGNIYHYVNDVETALSLQDCTSLAILGGFSADAGYTAVFSALCFGKTLHVIPVKQITSFHSLRSYFVNNKIDGYKITPSLIQFFLQQGDATVLLPQKVLILGGEACPISLAASLRNLVQPSCKIFNHYGPTETTVGVLTYELPIDIDDFPNEVPLGKPLEHVKVYILNDSLEPCEEGQMGELFISGELVANGYLRNEELTNQKFIVHAHHNKMHRMYRTGDLVTQKENRNIIYNGRADDQIKINGYRVELGEIESVIREYKTICKCVVLYQNRKLIAFYESDLPINEQDIHSFLKNSLPEYMLPHKWVCIKKVASYF
ncbi:amino acid adenylation domain-containing protein [Fulvivirga maritima]|uniref:amino acid adenylation domain-containing protein n=1 Tax=Fulvivirga maritima TaxID=2904247 RepID=UPI001F3EA9A7|nr:amino acid adenylation domain-containing protein [Fulvivirga maritima]UII27572.1 amino acid adenylation domain-containing protein [Fulvivirga maritima]